MQLLANIIAGLHFLLILFMTVTPFVTDHPLALMYYCYISFFIMLHWYTNNDTCVLTIIESKLRGKKSNDTFMGKLIKPVYNVTSREMHILTIGLFIFAILKSRIWEKERYQVVTNLLSIQWKIIKQVIYSCFHSKNTNTANTTVNQNVPVNIETPSVAQIPVNIETPSVAQIPIPIETPSIDQSIPINVEIPLVDQIEVDQK